MAIMYTCTGICMHGHVHICTYIYSNEEISRMKQFQKRTTCIMKASQLYGENAQS